MDKFLQTWNCKFNTKASLPISIDGITDKNAVATRFTDNFEDAYRPNSVSFYNKYKPEFAAEIEKYQIGNCKSDCVAPLIEVNMVADCINKLSMNKAAVIDSIEAEHLKICSPCFVC